MNIKQKLKFKHKSTKLIFKGQANVTMMIPAEQKHNGFHSFNKKAIKNRPSEKESQGNEQKCIIKN